LPKNFKEQELEVDYIGAGVGAVRIVAFTDNMKFDVFENMFIGTRAKGVFVHNKTKVETPFEGKVLGNELRTGRTIVVVEADFPGGEIAESFTVKDCVIFKPEK
ncbi:MAG: hypothetical protein IKJ55_05050, partial [Clostridia bacterium]|nr:hypothetical protein [Clostridia bacterium]